jgi:hypothetical protein
MTGDGRLDPPRPDQVSQRQTPRSPHAGARLQRVQIVNFPGQPVVVEDGGIPGALSASGNIGSGNTLTLIPAGSNPNGLKLWSASLSSFVAEGGAVTGFNVTDAIVDTAGNQYLALQNGLGAAGQSPLAVSQEMHGIQVPKSKAVQLVNGAGAGTALHQASATVIYTVLL